MFINCPYCRTLVATDPATDLPPTHCPQCASLLRRDASVEDDDTEPQPVDLGDLLEPFATGTLQATTQDAPREDSHADAADATDADALPHDDAVTDTFDGEDRIDDSEGAPPAVVAATPAKRRLRNAPSFVRDTERTPVGPRERWLPAVAAVLALLLGLQGLLADRSRLATDPRWRPVLNAVCGLLHCGLPPWREPTAFTLLQRDVRQHPNIPGALRVSATFRNDARWPQPWPSLWLSLSDVNGRPAGERSFRADEYLGGPPSQPELASGESATVAMDILEPAARIVAYDFSFR